MLEKVLRALRNNTGQYVSGEELARLSGITRAGIWKQINQLREMGYNIESSSRKGYRLLEAPELHPFEIMEGLNSRIFGKKIYFKPEVDSTIYWARRLANEGSEEGTVVLAESQTKGRGRLGRSWSSAPGKGLWFTMILRPKLSAAELPGITMLTAVAMARAIKNVTGVQVLIKWPNDLVYQNRKLAGVLAEINGEIDLVNYLTVSLGLNVNHLAADFPPELQTKATSLRLIKKSEVPRKALLQEFLKIFEATYFNLTTTGLPEVIEYARLHSATLGSTVRINQGFNRILTGAAVDLDRDGSLWLREPSGAMTRVYAGEIIENTE